MRYILTTILCCFIFSLSAFKYADNEKAARQKSRTYNANCAQATFQSDLNVNNVRARLLVGGDMWWDGNNAQYIVPQVAPGEEEVSSIFAAAIWMGGFDPNGNLKVAGQQFGTAAGNSDYWPGPLTEDGITQAETCKNWDRIFSVTGEEIDLHLAQFRQSVEEGVPYDVSLIPTTVLEWPGLGNEFFSNIFGFQLPDAPQGLAPFWDENADGKYTPQFGDYPVIEIRGCGGYDYADGMHFWIFNDNGNVHTESGADPLRMEVQALSFAYATNDALNDMTFTRYKLVNRAQESLDKAIFGIWMDPDLGCSEDDYIGCDTIRDLMYVYNEDAIDGSSESNCNGVPTYGDKVPYFGVDFMRGPLAPKAFGANGELLNPDLGQPFDTIVEIGMTSFIYFIRGGAIIDPVMVDPSTPQEYYNYLSGRWLNGAPLTEGGSGFGGTKTTNFAFPDEPNNPDGWSMCTVNLPDEDYRTVQSTGPFRLDPGQVNELTIGVPWVPDVTYPCPDMGRLFKADDLAQSMFDNCFLHLRGPDAPDIVWTGQDQKLIGELTNDNSSSNNRFESYRGYDPLSPPDISSEERIYNFEGYIVYQLLNDEVTQDELDNPEKARIAFQTDKANEASDIINWDRVDNPEAGSFEAQYILTPSLQVEGKNEGLQNTFELTTDLFTGQPFINHRTYYYMAIAYAFNEYEAFDPITERGQERPYIEGNRNIQVYSVIPREITNNDLDKIGVFPNPFIAASNIASSNLSNVVKIINLPAESTVTIYSLDGKFVRQFQVEGNLQTSPNPALEWDFTTASGAPLTSGTYLIHVQADGVGERTLKLVYVN